MLKVTNGFAKYDYQYELTAYIIQIIFVQAGGSSSRCSFGKDVR